MPEGPAVNPYTARVRRLTRLRQALAGLLLAAAAGLAAAYWLHGRVQGKQMTARQELRVPQLGLNVQQSAQGVTISKSSGGRPLFRIAAASAEKLRSGGLDRLRGVVIAIYGEDGKAADEIRGEEFTYEEASGELTATGPAEITAALAGEPPIRATAQGLTYNVKTAHGSIHGGFSFTLGAASGSAGSAEVDVHAGRVKASGGVRVHWPRAGQAEVVVSSQQAELARRSGDSRDASSNAGRVVLTGAVRVQQGSEALEAQRLELYLRGNQSLRAMDAAGEVRASDTSPGRAMAMEAERAHADFSAERGDPGLATLRLEGRVRMQGVRGNQQGRLTAGEAVMTFTPGHALQRLTARQAAQVQITGAQGEQLRAEELVFDFAPGAGRDVQGVRLQTLAATGGAWLQRADFDARAQQMRVWFDAGGEANHATASGEVQLDQAMAGGERRLASDQLSLRLATVDGRTQLTEADAQGHVHLQQPGREVRAERAEDWPQQGRAAFSGGVAAVDAQSRFRAASAVWSQAKDGAAELEASEVTASVAEAPVPGAAAGQPSVIQAQALQWRQPAGEPAHGQAAGLIPSSPGQFRGQAVFTGSVRLVQAPDLLRGDEITLDADQNELLARGHVIAVLVQAADRKTTKRTPGGPAEATTVSAKALDYQAAQSTARFAGDVVARTGGAEMRAPQLTVMFGRSSHQLEQAQASGGVRITEPGRIAQGGELVYTAATNMVVLRDGVGGARTGTPSILDAEQGEIHGDPLTFSLANGEIQVGSQGENRARGQFVNSPANSRTGHK